MSSPLHKNRVNASEYLTHTQLPTRSFRKGSLEAATKKKGKESRPRCDNWFTYKFLDMKKIVVQP